MIKYIYIYIYGSYSLGLKVILVGLLKLILKYLIFSNYQIKKEKNANKMVMDFKDVFGRVVKQLIFSF